jgi:hypothetical protein
LACRKGSQDAYNERIEISKLQLQNSWPTNTTFRNAFDRSIYMVGRCRPEEIRPPAACPEIA